MILYRLREWSLKGDQRKLLMYHGFTTLVKKGVQANISMSKNIVVFSDGTAKEGGQGPNTNVYKLFNLIEDRTVDQVAFYDRGLEVWPESHWPGFALREADVFKTYMAWWCI